MEELADAVQLTDKDFQMRVARESDIAVPRTWMPATWDDLRSVGTAKRLAALPQPAGMGGVRR